MKRPTGLAFRLAVRLWVAGVLIFGCVAGFIIVRIDAARTATILSSLNTRADALQTLVKVNDDGTVEMEFDDEITRDYGGSHPAAFFQLLDAGGKVIEQSDFAETTKATLTHPEVNNSLGYSRNIVIDRRRFQCLTRVLPANENQQGGDHENSREEANQRPAEASSTTTGNAVVRLVVGIDRSGFDRQFSDMAYLTLTATAGGLLLLCLLAWLLVRHALQPLAALHRVLAGYDEHNLAPLAIVAPDEIGTVIATLNQLIRQLDRAFTRERAFTADAAHELRTPIAEVRTLAEVAMRRQDLGVTERREYATVLATILRMQELVEKLLLLARADGGAVTLKAESIDVAQLLATVIAAHRQSSERRQLQVLVDPAVAPASTDPALLRIILDNLVTNAISYADAGSVVNVRVVTDARNVRIEVVNSAAALRADDCEKMFDRFWRRDQARSAGSGNGLGLSLAHTLAIILGGTLCARMVRPGMIMFVLQLPIGQQSP